MNGYSYRRSRTARKLMPRLVEPEQSVNKPQESPAFTMNDGVRELYGNVGNRVLESNVTELLDNSGEAANWC